MDVSNILKYGTIGGIIAGIAFTPADMIGTLITKGDAFLPLRWNAGIPLQRLPQTISTLTALTVGTVVHFMISIAIGIVTAFLLSLIPNIRGNKILLITLTALFLGFVVFPVNFYILAPLLDAPWFALQGNPIVQFINHTFFFGIPLGIYLARKYMMNPNTNIAS